MRWRPFHKPDHVISVSPVQTTSGPDMLETRTFGATWTETARGELSLWRVCAVVALAAFALGLLCGCPSIKAGRPGSSDWELDIKPVFPSLTPAPCEKEGP